MLGFVLNACTTNESESTEKVLSDSKEQVEGTSELTPAVPEAAELSPELQAQQEAERLADEKAKEQAKQKQAKLLAEKELAEKKLAQQELARKKLAQKQAKQRADKQKAERLALEQAKQQLEQQEEAERLFLQQAKQKAQEEEAERLALQQAQIEKEQAQQDAELLAQQQAAEAKQIDKPLTEQETQQEAEELAQQLAQQEAELLAQYEGARKIKVEQALNRLSQANYAFESKREVFVDGLAEIEVVMQLPNSLSASADSSLNLDLLDEEFRVDEFVVIKLDSSSPNDITITPISEDLQSVSNSTNPKWKWTVMAKKEGTYSLLLNIMPLINIENSDGTSVQTSGGNKTISEVIEVMARPFSLWDWSKTAIGMITIVIGTIITGVLINVLINLVRIKLGKK